MTSPEDRTSDERQDAAAAELESVRELMRLVTNAARIFRSYPPNNRLFLDLADQLGERFPAHLDTYGKLVLSVGRYELLCKGEEVYSETDPSHSLALKLYRDGVRRVQLVPGLEKEEIVGFVRILSQPIAQDSLEDDVVTLLWEEDLSHIRYAVLEEASASKPEPGAQDTAEDGSLAALRRVAGAKEPPAPPVPAFEGEYKDVRSEIQRMTREIKESLAALSEEVLQELQERVEREAGQDLAGRVALILFDTAMMEKDLEVTASAAALLGQLMFACVAEGRVAAAAETLARLKRLLSPEAGLSSQGQELIRAEIAKLREPEVLNQLGAAVLQDVASGTQNLRRFLVTWGEDGVAPAVTLASMVQDDQLVVDALLEMSQGHADRLLPALRDANPAAVRVALRVLGEVGDASLAADLSEALQQDDVDVKLETIRTLQKLGGEGALDLLELTLKEEDPRVRRAGVQVLGCFPGTRAVELLQQQVLEKGFLHGTIEEKRTVFSALAEAGGEAVLPLLAGVLRRKRWLHARKCNETRACAAHALGLVGTAEAAEILEPFRNADEAIVRSACRSALRRITDGKKGRASA